MISKQNKLVLIGLTAIGIQERDKLRRTEAAICNLLKQHGVDERRAEDWASELTYNEGDDPAVAVERVLKVLEIEVEPDDGLSEADRDGLESMRP